MRVLSERRRGLRLVGHSSVWGFTIYGDVPTKEVLAAAQDGLRQLRIGKRGLAIHPNCGSNLVVAGVLAGLGVFLTLGGLSRERERSFLDRLSRLPLACAVAVIAVALARPLGTAVQAFVTTEADVGDLRIVSITREERASVRIHQVRTEG